MKTWINENADEISWYAECEFGFWTIYFDTENGTFDVCLMTGEDGDYEEFCNSNIQTLAEAKQYCAEMNPRVVENSDGTLSLKEVAV
jgi:chloramphenicol O-acetyltransferase